MPKLAVRLLILSMMTTSLLLAPTVTQAEPATSHKHMKKKVRLVQPGSRAANPSANPFASKYDEDFDRKNTGGGGY